MRLVRYEKKNNHLAIITLNRPEKLNAINVEVMSKLCDAWIKYSDDDDAWIAILTGTGKAFSAGADKSWIELSARGQSGLDIFQSMISKDPFWSGKLDKPVLTAVNGLTIGAGLDLVLRSDLRIAGESAWFRQAEVERGNIMIFYDNLPCAIAAEIISGFTITAQRAYEVGMINRVVPDNKLMEASIEMAEELLTRVPLALYHALRVLRDMKNASTIVPRHMIDHYTTVLSKELVDTEDWREATTALFEKRKPVFKKR